MHLRGDETPERLGASSGIARRVSAARAFLAARVRPLAVALVAGAAVLLSGVVGPASWNGFGRSPVAPDDRAQMAAAERTIDSLRAAAYALERPGAERRRPAPTDAALLALAYHERLRLGVGSPFRLADFALRDPRLDARLRRATALSILARTTRGESHALDPLALATDAERLGAHDDPVVSASRQQAIIDSAVLAAPSARTGEQTVRLALALAQAERLVDRGAVNAGIYAAALARDRRLATVDARRLLAAAARTHDDALTLLQHWRADRRFAVEQPLLADPMHPSWPDATRDAIRLVAELRASARTPVADSGALTLAAASRAFVQRGYLPRSAALRVAELASVRTAPPQAPVTVTTAGARRRYATAPRPAALVPPDPADEAAIATRRRFLERTRTEESLVAEQAVARAALLAPAPTRTVSAAGADVADLTLAAAVAMRAYAQEPVWFPSFGAPDDEELRARFGLRRVAFDPVIPAAWRPYYRHLLASALSELRGVLPSLSFDGLTVRVGETVKRDSALALHDPASRTMYLPAATGAGTIAHEIAHDLDWQTARTRLALRGAYSTDRAARDGAGPASLTRSVRGLTAARPRSGGSPRGESRERPAELFARGIDWLAAAALAREGRMNGYLTSVQDAAIPGYAGVVVPEPGERGADALIDVLDDMTTLPWVTRAWYLDRFGAAAAVGPDAVARLALGATTGYSAERTLRALGLAGALVVAEPTRIGSWRGSGASPACAVMAREPWRAELLWAAAESRARGALQARARRWVGTLAVGPGVWESQAVLGAPWSPTLGADAVRRMRDAVLRQVARDDEARGPVARSGIAAVIYGACR
jgi:hypothetical protein